MSDTILQIFQVIIHYASLFLGWIKEINVYVHDHFGLLAQITLDVVLFYLFFLLISKIFKAFFDLLKYVAIPSVILSGVGYFVFSLPFMHILPVCVCVLIVVNLLRS